MTNEINWKLLDEALDWIEQHPERWNQGTWACFREYNDLFTGNECGTAFCLAGTVCQLAGLVEIKRSDYGGFEIGLIPSPYGPHWAVAAAELLGVTSEQSHVIFAANPPGVSYDTWRDPQKFRQFVYDLLKGKYRNVSDCTCHPQIVPVADNGSEV